MKKYSITEESREYDGVLLYRIRADRGIETHSVKKGDLGGWIEKESNLSQDGDCWVADDSVVLGCATVKDDALVEGESVVDKFATISGSAIVRQQSDVCGNATIQDNAVVSKSFVSENAVIKDWARVHNASINGNATVEGLASLNGGWISGTAVLREKFHGGDSRLALFKGVYESGQYGQEYMIFSVPDNSKGEDWHFTVTNAPNNSCWVFIQNHDYCLRELVENPYYIDEFSTRFRNFPNEFGLTGMSANEKQNREHVLNVFEAILRFY